MGGKWWAENIHRTWVYKVCRGCFFRSPVGWEGSRGCLSLLGGEMVAGDIHRTWVYKVCRGYFFRSPVGCDGSRVCLAMLGGKWWRGISIESGFTMFAVDAFSEAPTGRPKVAQGNALGLPTRNTRGLKARPNREALRPDLQPSIRACGRVPGRCMGYRMALGI